MTEQDSAHTPDDETGAKAPVNDSEGTPKTDGVGSDEGTIPNHPNGIALGHSDGASTFEPEEDEHAE
ncbi:hypothetical protein [Labedella endophytica]|uniref:Uncharacterized protein n=1 Tax=Labedella endophytica TaxID=1523160 RepID=A0A3S0XYI2_9MICO|nr:hypothetical protein [Labedella endophytica]RUQ99214.1 hypothetical protein ELQ94_12985 [Labedella endophytica]